MSFPRSREAAPVKETAAYFYSTVKVWLNLARVNRDEALLRRCAIRINDAKFNALDDEQKADLRKLYSAALAATGALSP